jgi:hypothetical protein
VSADRIPAKASPALATTTHHRIANKGNSDFTTQPPLPSRYPLNI